MKQQDINKFKGDVKTAVQEWVNTKIEEIVPDRPTMRFLAKNYANNVLNRVDSKMNVWIDNLYMMVAGKDGVVDTDTMVDMAVGVFKEVQPFEYHLGGGFVLQVGNGEVALNMPRNAIVDALVGDFGRIRFTSEDILEFKNLLN